MFDRTLVALDDTETSSRAFTTGLEIARFASCTVVVGG